MLAEKKPLEIIQSEVIPALNIVGADFEKKKVYLPQLLMAAEAAKSAFEEVKVAMAASDDGNGGSSRCPFVIATVHGDIHDIGKNIVKLILENYGFAVSDLGKDVPEQTVVDEAPWAKVCVGGAVLTQEYADAIGADKYCRDAMETVRYAEEIDEALKNS